MQYRLQDVGSVLGLAQGFGSAVFFAAILPHIGTGGVDGPFAQTFLKLMPST